VFRFLYNHKPANRLTVAAALFWLLDEYQLKSGLTLYSNARVLVLPNFFGRGEATNIDFFKDFMN
jgi:hypothetical protein